MNPIVQAPDETYVDLSKIVAISPVYETTGNSCYGIKSSVKFIFDIYFISIGIPFKQEIDSGIQKIQILSDSYDLHTEELLSNETKVADGFTYKNTISDETRILYKERIEEFRKDWDSKREMFADLWRKFKNEEQAKL